MPLALAALLLAGCAQPVALQPAEDATNAQCAEIIVRLPDAIGTGEDALTERDTNAQSTAAWGNPAAVIVRCGVPVPPPSTDQCVTVDGVDWLLSRQDDAIYVYTSYGRDPATEVVIDNDLVTGITALEAVSSAVGVIPADRACTNPEDAEGFAPEP